MMARQNLPSHAIYNVVRSATEMLEKLGPGRAAGRRERIKHLKGRLPAAKLLRAGVAVGDLVGAFPPSALKDAGVPAPALRAAGASLADLLDAGYDAASLKAADANDPGALLAADYSWDDVVGAFDHDPERIALQHLLHATGDSLGGNQTSWCLQVLCAQRGAGGFL